MRGCNNCAGYEPDDLGIGGVNQCKNGKYNGNGHLCNCDAWTPDFEQGLIDRNLKLEAELAKALDMIERLTVVGTGMYDRIYGLYETGWTSYCPQDWEILVAEWELRGEK